MSEPTIHKLSLQSLCELDNGIYAEAFNQELDAAMRDCYDRGNVGKPRKVTLTVELKPVMDHTGIVDALEYEIEFKNQAPTRRGRRHEAMVRHQAGKIVAIYNELSPDNSRQKTFDIDDEEDQHEQ